MSLDHSKLEKVKHRGSKVEAQCPACLEAGRDKTGNHLIIYPNGAFACAANPGDKEHRRRIAELAGDESDDWKKDAPESFVAHRNGSSAATTPPRREVASYDYQDANGNVVYKVVRYEPKDFRPFLVGASAPGLNGVERVPYRLPEILKAETVWVVEGERDADNLSALGLTATCRAGGSSTWEPELSPWFKGKKVILCGDNDEPGRKYMDTVEAALQPIAKSVKRVVVPSPAKDISDHLAELSEHEAGTAVDALVNPRGVCKLSPPPA
jgi:5S rRNA maturation endonuclease (ribonuclease M5)